MEFYNIDIPEMERQRYNSIKKSGEYIELNILIGVEDEEENGVSAKSPVVSTCMHNCGPQEVACLYATLHAVSQTLERKYPVECLMGKMGMRIENMGSVDSSLEDDKED